MRLVLPHTWQLHNFRAENGPSDKQASLPRQGEAKQSLTHCTQNEKFVSLVSLLRET